MIRNNIKFLLASFTFVCLLLLEGINADAIEVNNDSNQVLVEDQQSENGDITQDSSVEQQLENGNNTQASPVEKQLEVGSSTITLPTNQQSEDVTTDASENELSTVSTQIQSDSWKKDANEPLDNAVPVIYKYEIDGDGYIVPGEEFTLKFTVYNPSVSSKLGNIRIAISQENSLFYPKVGNTNSVYIGYLLPLSYSEGTIKLKAAENINSDQIIANLNLTYTDNYYPNQQQNLTAVLPVSTNGKLNINSVDLPSSVYVGTNNRLSISYANNGLSSVNNVVLHMTGSSIEDQDVSFGSIGSGSSMSSDVYLDFIESGQQTVKLYFTYADSNGQSYETDELEYNFDVKEYENEDSSDVNNDLTRINKNSLLTMFVLVGILIIIGIYIFSYLYKRKKDAELMKGDNR